MQAAAAWAGTVLRFFFRRRAGAPRLAWRAPAAAAALAWAAQALGAPGVATPRVATPDVATPNVAAPGGATPDVTTPGAAAPGAAASAAASTTGLDLAKSVNCLACHQVRGRRVGPPFVAVAQRFAGQPGAADYLAQSIRNGGRGRWGAVPMPAQPQVSAQQAHELAVWILSLAKQPEAR